MKGFTLIEILVTIAVFTLAAAVLSALIVQGYRTQYYGFAQALAVNEARKGVETMVKEIREAVSGDDGSYMIEKAEDYQFIFYSDIDTDETVERIRYFIDGTDFKKGVIKPTGSPLVYLLENEDIVVLSNNVINMPPIFRYFDGNGQELPAPARLMNTKLMRVYLVVNVNSNRVPQNFILESDVQIRNLKTNL